MHKITKLCLKKPVSTVIIIVALLIFGISSIMGMNMQLTPDMEYPMIIAYTVYPQAGPEEVDRLVSQKLENVGATIEGLEDIQSSSSENLSLVIYQFEYGTDLDEAYTSLQEEIQMLKTTLPESAKTPVLIIMDINAMQSMSLSVTSKSGSDVLKFVNDTLEPDIKKINNVASTAVSGGKEQYIKVQVIPEKLTQYGISTTTIASTLGGANFTMPAGSVEMGNQTLDASSQIEYKAITDLQNLPITTSTGQVIHLSDVSNVTMSDKEATSVSRFNGTENVGVEITKKSGTNAVKLSKDVKALINRLTDEYKDIEITVTYDSAESIVSSLSSVGETLVLGIFLSMLVLFIFFGDIKASLIVGSSMPVSLLVTVILMKAMGFSLNIVTMGALVIGIGMMVDNSIVVLEMCFQKKDEGLDFEAAAYDAVKTVVLSVTASTITTVVVYLPLSLMKGLSGQLFGQLGFTIIFSLVASLISSVTLVPLCFAKYCPIEKKGFFMNKAVRKVADVYGGVLTKILRHKFISAIVGIVFMVVSVFCVKFIHTELIPSTDEGVVSVSIAVRPGLSLDAKDEILRQVEDFVAQDPDVETFSASTSGGGLSASSAMSVYANLKKDRSRKTADIANEWNKTLVDIKNADVECTSSSSSMGSMSNAASKEIDIKGSDLDELKEAANELATKLSKLDGVTRATSSFADASSKAEINIDPIKATAAGFTPALAAQQVYVAKNGSEAIDNMTIDEKEYSVKVEYPKDLYDTVPELMNMTITNTMGNSVVLSDIATIEYTDSPMSISRKDKYYNASVTCLIDIDKRFETEAAIDEFMQNNSLPRGVYQGVDAQTEAMNEEFMAIGGAILTALWLVFMVMTMQFESARFAAMIMICIPFSLIGSFLLLLFTGSTLSMVSLMGFLMLEGIVVNNGILMIDTTNQMREKMDVSDALVAAGKSRLRPILMTTLTTILSMVPLAIGIGENGVMMQGMAVVIVGGLIASTLLTLLLLPSFYMIIRKRDKKKKDKDDNNTKVVEEAVNEPSESTV